MIKATAFTRLLIVSALAVTLSAPAVAQNTVTAEDEAAIRAVALDYIEGWYTGDAERMERALHPELAKRLVISEDGRSNFVQMSAMSLVQDTREGGGSNTPPERQHKDVMILDIYQNAASARIHASGWVDYLHLAKWNGDWKIVNVLFELHPQE